MSDQFLIRYEDGVTIFVIRAEYLSQKNSKLIFEQIRDEAVKGDSDQTIVLDISIPKIDDLYPLIQLSLLSQFFEEHQYRFMVRGFDKRVVEIIKYTHLRVPVNRPFGE
jgi:hypothetical protein